MKYFGLIITAILFSILVSAQNAENPKIKISDLCISNGLNGTNNISSDLSDFLKLAPSSDMLNSDFTGFGKSEFYTGVSTNDNIFNISLGLLFYNKEKQTYKSNPQFNIGITFKSASTFSAYYSKQEKIRFDTLSSQTSSFNIFLDTIINESYQMNYLYQQLGINANLIFRTQPEARWSLYSGIGISALTSLMSATHIYYNYSQYTAFVFPNNSLYYDYSSNNTNTNENYVELHSNKTNISVYTYLNSISKCNF